MIELTKAGAIRELNATMKELGDLPTADPREMRDYLAMKWLIDYGRCQVLGVEVMDSHGYPPPTYAVMGIGELLTRMSVSLIRAKTLPDTGHIAEVFGDRMCIWLVEHAAQFSLDMWFTVTRRHHFHLSVDIGTLREEACRFDEVLLEHSQYIRKMDCDGLPRTCRGMIIPEIRKTLPWWLSGGLEDRLPKIHR